jgi:hypothetical protein
LRRAGVQFITPDVVAIPQEARAQLGFKKAMMVLDPSGHAIRLIELNQRNRWPEGCFCGVAHAPKE